MRLSPAQTSGWLFFLFAAEDSQDVGWRLGLGPGAQLSSAERAAASSSSTSLLV